MKCYVDMPYPKIKIVNKDINLAKKILSAYAGSVSEDTAIHTYTFQMLLFSDNEKLKEILEGISIVEMHHLEILGSLIKALGVTPLFLELKNDNVKWFSGEYVAYHKTLEESIINDIKIEQEAILGYEQIIRETDNEDVIHILKRIILDERYHIKIFKDILENINFYKIK